MNIGTTIKNARKKLNMTQEQLAEYLNVSISAVSQWESDKTSPDITIIPSICNLLNISADELLGVNILKKQEKIASIKANANKYSEIGNHKEAIKILREGLIEFPNSFELMIYLSNCLFMVYMNEGEPEDSRNEIISLGEKILAECTIDDIRHSAIQTLCYVYPEEKAVKLAKTMPNNFLTCNALLSNIYNEGDKCYNRRRYNAVLSILDAIRELLKMNVKLDSGELALSIDEDLIVCKKALSLIEILCENKDYGEYTIDIVNIHFKMTMLLCKKGKADEAIECFEKIVNEVVSFDTEYDRTKKHTSILLSGDNYGGFEFSTTENLSYGISRLAERREELNLIKNDKRFINLLEKLKITASNGRNFDNYRP